MSPALELNGVGAGYNGVAVVRDIHLHVEAGEVVALLGPNGAGKTTVLRTISGTIPAIEGDVSVLGGPTDVKRPHRLARRGVAHVPEWPLVAATFGLGLCLVPIYLRYRNLWALGVAHGWLGTFFYLWILGRDPWLEAFG